MKDIGTFFRHFDDWVAHSEAERDIPAMISFAEMLKARETLGAISYETLEPLFTPS